MAPSALAHRFRASAVSEETNGASNMNRTMDALVLAGGLAPPELAAKSGASDRALIELEGETMIARVLRALQATRGIETVAAVANPDALASIAKDDAFADVLPLAAGGRMVDNLTRGIGALSSPQVLVCTCDVPLVSSASFEEFVQAAASRDLELAYPVVRRAACEAMFPGGRRTYAHLADGDLTGGNAVIVPRRIISQVGVLVDAAYNARKNPLGLAKLLGPAFVVRFAAKRLTVADVEARASRVLSCRAGAVEMQNAAIAFDVDKPEDLEIAARFLKNARTNAP